jgi:hypothetical protein
MTETPLERNKNCGNCDRFIWNGTRYGGVCNNTVSALFDRTLSCLYDACSAHIPHEAKDRTDGR